MIVVALQFDLFKKQFCRLNQLEKKLGNLQPHSQTILYSKEFSSKTINGDEKDSESKTMLLALLHPNA